MSERRLSPVRSSALYLGFGLLNQGIPFLLLPILTRYLSPEEFGFVSIYQVMVSLGVAIIGMNLPVNISREFFKYDQDYIAKIVFNLIVILIAAGALVTVALGLYFLFFPDLFGLPAAWAFSLPLVSIMITINLFNLNILRNRYQVYRYGAFQLVRVAVDVPVSIILVVAGLSWQGRTSGILAAGVAGGMLSLWALYQSGYLRFELDMKAIHTALGISLPLIPHTLSLVIINLLDRLFIDNLLGKDVLGVYNIGYMFGMTVSLVTEAVSNLWTPWIFEQLTNVDDIRRRRIIRLTYIIGGGYALLGIAVTIGSYIAIPVVTDPAYHGGVIYVFWVAMGYVFRGFYALIFPYLVHVGKTRSVAVITSVAAVANIIGNLLLIDQLGAVGAAIATLISFVIMFVGVWWYAARVYPMPWFDRSILLAS